MKGMDSMKKMAVIAVFACSVLAPLVAEEQNTVLKPGTEAPSFSLPALNGSREALRVWCGSTLSKPYVNSVKHVVIINFWATYCKPCQKEIPQLAAFMKKQEGKAVKLYCVSIDREGASKVKPFVSEKGYTVPVLLDPYARTAERYGVKSVPALFVIGPNGVIQYSAMGYDEKADLVNNLDNLIAEIESGKTVVTGAVHVAGEAVAAQGTGEKGSGGGVSVLSPKERWDAIVRVECGEKLENVAEEFGVTPQEIKTWYKDLKKTVLQMWGGTVANTKP